MIEHGEDHLKLQLRPSRMGEMEINISRGEQGLSIALQTDSENTAQLLKGHLDELKSSLARSGVQLQDLNVNQGSQQEAHAFRQPNRPAAAHPEQTAEPETASQPLRYREDNSVEYLI
jgi:flagellar hook-length control protein FliK